MENYNTEYSKYPKQPIPPNFQTDDCRRMKDAEKRMKFLNMYLVVVGAIVTIAVLAVVFMVGIALCALLWRGVF
jgi:hypothetical protein